MASYRALSATAKQGRLAVMLRGVLLNTTVVQSKRTPYMMVQRFQSHDSETSASTTTFDEKLLEHLVCPLSKKDLRYDKQKNELVCDELGVAYPIVNGIPNLVPQDARILKNSSPDSS